MAHSGGEVFQKPADSEINTAPSSDIANNLVKSGCDRSEFQLGVIQEASICSKIELSGIMDDKAKQTKKLLQEQVAAIYNPNKDLWRHGNGGSFSESPVSNEPSTCDAGSNPDREHRNTSVRLSPRNNLHASSFHEKRHRESSFFMDLPKARDSLSISQPVSFSSRQAGSVFQCHPKARDSLRINQPASPQSSFRKPHVKFVPQVHFPKSPDMSLNKPGPNGYPSEKSLGIPQSSLDIDSAVGGDKFISNLISAWYWTGYYAGYKGSVSEQ